MGTFADPGGGQVEGAGVGRSRLGKAGTLRLRASLMLVLHEKGWSLRQLARVFGVKSQDTIWQDIRAIPPEAAERFKALATSMLGNLPNPDGFVRGVGEEASPRLEPSIPDPPPREKRPPVALTWSRTHRSPEARRLAAEAAIDARCLAAVERCRGDIRGAAQTLGITPARVRAAVARKSGES